MIYLVEIVFYNVSTWVEVCKNQSPKTIFMVLVGNKSDLADKKQDFC